MPSLPPSHLQLAKRLRGKLVTAPTGPRVFWATVVAVSAGPPKTVTIQQGTLEPVPDIRYDDSYTPTVGDTVWGVAVGGDYMVVGSLNPAASGGPPTLTWTNTPIVNGVIPPGAQAVRYAKDSLGFVIIEGMFYLSANTSGVLFTLPVGMRPAAVQGISLTYQSGRSYPYPGYIDTNGAVSLGYFGTDGSRAGLTLPSSTVFGLYARFYVGN